MGMRWLWGKLVWLGKKFWWLLKKLGGGFRAVSRAIGRFIDLEGGPVGPRIKCAANVVFTAGVIWSVWEALKALFMVDPVSFALFFFYAILIGGVWLSRLVGLLIRGFGILVENSEQEDSVPDFWDR